MIYGISGYCCLGEWCDVCTNLRGQSSRYIHMYGMSTEGQFVNTLNDVIRKSVVPWTSSYTSDRTQVEVSKRVKDILRFVIADWQPEPCQQQQNYSERIYQDVKKNTNWVCIHPKLRSLRRAAFDLSSSVTTVIQQNP